MPRTPDPGGPKFTFEGGKIIPVAQSKAVKEAQAGGRSPDSRGTSFESSPSDLTPVLEPGMDGYGGQPAANGQTTQGGTAGQATGPTADYSNFLNIYGLPGDVQTKVASIFANTADVSQATALAMAYIRGTSWYAQTYPGIQEGIARGVITNEADYRNYLNNTNVLTKQYLGRDISGQEVGDFLKQGYDVSRIGRIYQGGAIQKTNQGDWNYAAGAFDSGGPFTAEESAALGQEQAGIDTLLGQKVQRRLDLAKQRMSAVFGGSLATPSLSLANGRLAATSLGGTAAPDVAA